MQRPAGRSSWIIAGAIASALVLLAGRCSVPAIVDAALASILCFAASHDLAVRRIENGTVLAIVFLRAWQLVLEGIADPQGIAARSASSLIGAAIVLAVLLGTACLLERRSGAAGIGGGDVKLLAALGFCFGWEAGLAIMGLSSILLVLHRSVPRALRPESGAVFAFAPYIAVASLFTMLFL